MRREIVKPATEPAAPEPGRTSFFTVYFSIVLPMFMAILDQTIVATALPAIGSDLGNVSRLSWIVVAYLIANTVASPIYGRVGDFFGRRRLIVAALIGFMASSALCSLAPSVDVLIACRVLQGFAGGGILVLCHALIGERIPPRDRARYQGYLATIAVVANCLGPLIGGFLAAYVGWRAIFLVNLPLGVVAILLTLRVPDIAGSRGEGEKFRLDYWGVLLFGGFVACFLALLQELQRFSADVLPLMILLGAGAAMALVLLVRQEIRTPAPLFPVALLRNPNIWRSDVLVACHGATLISMITFLPIYMRVVRGASISEVGLLIVPMTISIGLGSLIVGRLTSKTGLVAIFPSVGQVVSALSLACFALFGGGMTIMQLAVLFGSFGLFMGTVMGVAQVVVQVAAGRGALGAAGATIQFSRTLGAALGTATCGVALFIAIRASGGEAISFLGAMLQGGPGALDGLEPARAAAIRAEMAEGFRIAFLVPACFAMIAAVTAWTMPMRRI